MEEETYEPTNTIYIKSNTATVMRFLTFLSVVLFAIVAGLCSYIIFTYKYDENYHFDKSKQFYFTLKDDAVTVEKFVDNTATSCEIPSSVTFSGRKYPVVTIGESAFTNHHYLTEVRIPDTVTTILGNAEKQKGAFSGCTALKTVQMGQAIDTIGEYAFKNCIALTSVEIPATVQFVKEGAFENCYNLETVRLNGKVTLKNGSFANCIGVRTLKLDSEAELNDQTREALTDLTGLNQFRILGEGSRYEVSLDGNCLLIAYGTSLIKNYTLVLGGRGAEVPEGVTDILDWAWGKRAADNLYVSDKVKNIGTFAFGNKSICTNAPEKPEGWLTTVVVYTNAQMIRFVAMKKTDSDEETGTVYKLAYIFNDENSNSVMPEYDDLFADVESETPFDGWGTIGEDKTCYAKYKTKYNEKEHTSLVDNFIAERNKAAKYIVATDTRLSLTIDFWEEFKSIYYRAMAIEEPDVTHDYILSEITETLRSLDYKIDYKNNYPDILESSDWEIGLQNLVDTIDQLDAVDYLFADNTQELIDEIHTRTKDAKNFLSGSGYVIAPEDTWRELRAKFESLLVDVSENGPLGRLIADCQSLKHANYTDESWANLQTCLAGAVMISEHNQSITTVRKKLEEARANLVEILPTESTVILETWISICSDLLISDYQEGYEHMLQELRNILDKNLLTSSEVEQATRTLQVNYRNLVLVKNPTQTNPGIFNMRTIPFFILAAILFTGAVVAGAQAVYLKRQLRRVS